ncbi:MAG: ankyrin repeat domain-containing protein [Myxococcota bacterium]
MPPNTIRELFTTDLPSLPTELPSDGGNPWPALHLAAFAGDLHGVRRALASGTPVDARSDGSTGATALHCAVAAGCVEAVDVLLAAGARVGARDGAGYTPLLLAAERGDAPLVKRLLRAGADPHHEIGDVSPLTAARRGRHQRVVGLLRQVR